MQQSSYIFIHAKTPRLQQLPPNKALEPRLQDSSDSACLMLCLSCRDEWPLPCVRKNHQACAQAVIRSMQSNPRRGPRPSAHPSMHVRIRKLTIIFSTGELRRNPVTPRRRNPVTPRHRNPVTPRRLDYRRPRRIKEEEARRTYKKCGEPHDAPSPPELTLWHRR